MTTSGASDPKPGEIERVWLDGHRANLTHNPSDDTEGVLSPDGRWIAFISDRSSHLRKLALYVMDANGRNSTRVSSTQAYGSSDIGGAAWSPDSRRIAFVAVCPQQMISPLPSCLYLTDLKGRQRRIARSDGKSWFGQAAWSPDGQRIAVGVFHRFLPHKPRAYVTTTIRVVTPAGKLAWEARGEEILWSKTGRLATRFLIGPVRHLFVYNESGTLLAASPGPTSWVAWSPNGERLASQHGIRGPLIVRAGGGTGKIILSVNRSGSAWVDDNRIVSCCSPHWATISAVDRGSASRRIAAPRYVTGLPVISPDGLQMATVDEVYSGSGTMHKLALLSVTNLSGSGTRILARNVCVGVYATPVQWLPDSRSLIYSVC